MRDLQQQHSWLVERALSHMKCNLGLDEQVDVTLTIDASNGSSLHKASNGYWMVLTGIEYHKPRR